MRCAVGVWVVIAIAIAGCQSLPDVGSGACGNLVLEAGEDCDGFGDGEATACGSPGTLNGCFFTCDKGDEETSPCPEGFGCGADGRCRAPSDSFLEGAQVSLPVPDFKVADIDGDGTDDLIGSSQNAFHVAFGDGDGQLTSRTFPNAALGGFFSVGNLNGDGSADIVASDGIGITAFLGRPGQTIEPVPFALFDVGESVQIKLTKVSGIFAVLDPDDNVRQFTFQDDPGSGRAFVEDGGGGAAILIDTMFGAGFDVDAIETPLSTADLDNDNNEEMVLTHVGADQVWLIDFDGGAGNNQVALIGAPLNLPGAFRASGRAFLADVDGDGDLDVSVGMEQPGTGIVALGRSLNTGGTFPDITQVSIFGVTEVFSPGLRLLEVGPLDGDNRADYILTNGVFRANVINAPDFTGQVVGSSFFAGKFVDLNGDGRNDIVTIPEANQGVEVYLQADEPTPAFNRSALGTANHFAGNGEIVTGDFDGDLVTDVALTASSAAGDSTIEVLFGSLDNRFEAPVRMARLDQIIQLHANRFLSNLDFDDAIDDLLVTAFQDGADERNKIISAFRGDTSRAMSAPLVLLEDDGGEVFYIPFQTAIGTIDGAPGIFAATVAFRGDNTDLNMPNCVLKETGCGFAWKLPITSDLVAVNEGPSQALGINFDRLACYEWTAVDLFDSDGINAGTDNTDELAGVFFADRCAKTSADEDVVLFDFEADSADNVELPISSEVGLRRFITGDLDNDNVAEIVSVFGRFDPDNSTDGEGGVVVLWNEPGQFRPELVTTTEVATIAVAKGRLNADSFEDLVLLGIDIVNGGDPQVYAALFNDGGYDTPEVRGEFGFGTSIGIADLNRDGLGDLVIGDGNIARVFLAEPAEPRGSQQPVDDEGEGE